MSISIHTAFQVIITAHSIMGIVASAFIVAVGCVDWVRRKKLSACDMILVCLSSSRLLLQGAILHSTLHVEIQQPNVLKVQSVLTALASMACLWFASCLSIFYCVKITTFTHRYFLLMKMRITVMVPLLLLGSALVSLISSLPFIWVDYSIRLCNSTRSHLKNGTEGIPSGNISFLESFVLFLTLAVIPFLFFLASSTLLITSLWKHTKQMRGRTTGFQDASTEAHVTAIKALISFLMLYVISFGAVIVLRVPSCRSESQWKYNICSLVVAVCPSVHSVLLILLNLRLKVVLQKVLSCTVCHSEEPCQNRCCPL